MPPVSLGHPRSRSILSEKSVICDDFLFMSTV